MLSQLQYIATASACQPTVARMHGSELIKCVTALPYTLNAIKFPVGTFYAVEHGAGAHEVCFAESPPAADAMV